MTGFWKLAWRNLGRNFRRTLATGSAIVVGYAGLCLLGGYIVSSEEYLRINMVYTLHNGHLAIFAKDGVESFYSRPRRYQVPGETIAKIASISENRDDVELTVPILTGMGLLSHGERSVPVLATGIAPKDENAIQNHPEVLRWKDKLGIHNVVRFGDGGDDETVSVTASLARLIGKTLPLEGQDLSVQLAGQSFWGDLSAVNANLGFIHTTGQELLEDTNLIAPIKLLQDLYGTDGAAYVAVYLKDKEAIPEAKAWFEKELGGDNVDVVPFWDERIGLYYIGNVSFLNVMSGFFIFLIFSAVMMSIMNSMTLGILERRGEIGTMKSIGFRNNQIADAFGREGLLLGVIGVIVGFAIAMTVAFMVNTANIRFKPPGVEGDIQFFLNPQLSFCFWMMIPLILISYLTSFFVAKRQVKKSIVDLLHAGK